MIVKPIKDIFHRQLPTKTETSDKRLTKQTRGKEGEERREEAWRGEEGRENQQAIISLIWSPY